MAKQKLDALAKAGGIEPSDEAGLAGLAKIQQGCRVLPRQDLGGAVLHHERSARDRRHGEGHQERGHVHPGDPGGELRF
ncbi:MAG: hypothetical protein MZV49_09620 [Rhodopseudomonas palustris]|nr:hypothetical protein [Rhodopseudomonas palustris]